MPPRKRQRTALSPTPSTATPSRTTPTAPTQTPLANASTPPTALPPSVISLKQSASTLTSPVIADPDSVWTPAQETDLFKALIRYKPSGIHKHFHMLCVSAFLRSHGHCLLPPSSAAGNTSTAERLVPHTRIPAIWAHLATLYDLEALDERENVHALGPAEVLGSDWATEGEFTREFSLPERGEEDAVEDDGGAVFARLMWRKRFPERKERRARDDRGRRGSLRGTRAAVEDETEVDLLSSSPPVMEVTRNRDGVVIGPEDTSPIAAGRGRKGTNGVKDATPKGTPAPAPTKQSQAVMGRIGRRSGRVTLNEAASREEENDDGEEDVEEDEEHVEEDNEEENEEANEDDDEGDDEEGNGEERSGAEEESGEENEEDSNNEEQEEVEEAEEATKKVPARGTRSGVTARGTGRGRGRGRGRGGRGTKR